MGYRVFSFRDSRYAQKSEADEFFHAAEKARESIEKMHDLAREMEDRYGERYFGERGGYYGDRYGMRGGYYGGHEPEMWEDDMYGERRRRDSRGRYM